MEKLIIEATKSSPEINFDPDDNHLNIRGESYPENAAAFYQPILDWIQKFLVTDNDRNIIVDIELLYFNSSSSKVLSDIFDQMEIAAGNESSITINWRYHCENDMSLEYGEEFQEDYEKLNFKLIEFDDAD